MTRDWDDGTVNHAASAEWNGGADAHETNSAGIVTTTGEREQAVEPYEPQYDFVHPVTYEAIQVAQADDQRLATLLDDLRNHEHAIREAKSILSREALRRMDFKASYTYRAGPFTLKSRSPQPEEEFDALALREDLLALADDGVISIELVDRAVETIITYKARKAGINALRKLGGVARDTVDAHAHKVAPKRYVTVTRGAS